TSAATRSRRSPTRSGRWRSGSRASRLDAVGSLVRMGSSTSPVSPNLSTGQIQDLAAHGEERTAAEGAYLVRIGDKSSPLAGVRDGEAAILDAAGNLIVSQGPGGFIGEMSLLSGQTVFVDAVVTKPMRYIAVDRNELRSMMFEDAALADV